MRTLKEAVEAWFESCIERGVLDQAMREADWRPLAQDESFADDDESVVVNRAVQADESDILGDMFPLRIEIPAYQAAAFMSASA